MNLIFVVVVAGVLVYINMVGHLFDRLSHCWICDEEVLMAKERIMNMRILFLDFMEII